MRRSLLVLAGLVVVVGCDSDDVHRTVFVEVTSSPSGLLMSVSIGFSDTVEFEAHTPVARNVRARVLCNPGVGPPPGSGECVVFGSASVTSGDPVGKRVTMCLTDAGERDCATSNDGAVSVRMTVKVD